MEDDSKRKDAAETPQDEPETTSAEEGAVTPDDVVVINHVAVDEIDTGTDPDEGADPESAEADADSEPTPGGDDAATADDAQPGEDAADTGASADSQDTSSTGSSDEDADVGINDEVEMREHEHEYRRVLKSFGDGKQRYSRGTIIDVAGFSDTGRERLIRGRFLSGQFSYTDPDF